MSKFKVGDWVENVGSSNYDCCLNYRVGLRGVVIRTDTTRGTMVSFPEFYKTPLYWFDEDLRLIKEEKMEKETYEVTGDVLRKMAEKCPTAKDVLKEGFPAAFEERWENITDRLEMTNEGIGKGYIEMSLKYKGETFGYLDIRGAFIYNSCRDKYRVIPYYKDQDSIVIEKKM